LLVLGFGVYASEKRSAPGRGGRVLPFVFFLEAGARGIKGISEGGSSVGGFQVPILQESPGFFCRGIRGTIPIEYYGFYLCNRCKETSVEVNQRLIKATRGKIE
jgi:hypothetical protein